LELSFAQQSDVFATLVSFHAFVQTQFNCPIACIQTDNGKEFDNSALRSFMAAHEMVLRLTCPYTSQQNGHAERILRMMNDNLRTMLLHVGAPTSFCPNVLVTATYLLNRCPCRSRNDSTPHHLLLGVPPDYSLFVSLAIAAIQTPPQPQCTNSHRVPCHVSFSVTQQIPKVTGVMILSHVEY
jgi:transposase InsO family protein